MVQLYAIFETEPTYYGPDGWMLNLKARHCVFDLAVHNSIAMVKERGQPSQSQVAVLVDGASKDLSTIPQVPLGVVSATAEEGETERGTRNDQQGLAWLLRICVP